jgi:hypothetical protein
LIRILAVTLIAVLWAGVVPCASSAPEGADFEYLLKPGESLWTVAERFLVPPYTWRDLQRHNGVRKVRALPPGSRIMMPPRWLRMAALEVEVTYVSGKVQRYVKNAGAGEGLARGMRVQSGDRLKTEAQGYLSLRLPDGSTVQFAPESDVVLQAQHNPQLKITRFQFNVTKGRVESQVVPRRDAGSVYEIITPIAHLGVRGTRFEVAVAKDAKSAVSQVDEGKVTASNPGLPGAPSVMVDAGFGTVVREGQVPLSPVAQLPAANLSSVARGIQGPAVTHYFPSVPGAAAYRAQLSRDANFREILSEVQGSEAGYRFSSLTDGQYFVRVRALDSLGIQGRPASVSFLVRDIDI